MNPIYTMKGVGEILEVFEDKVAITPKGIVGFLSKGLKGTKMIPFYSITALQFKKSGLTSGYLQFTVPGGNESERGVFAAASNENTFMFAGHNEMALEIKDYIEKRMMELRRPEPPSSNNRLSDELQKLANMKEAGILSEEEFMNAKRKMFI
jgi:hypothetical protein